NSLMSWINTRMTESQVDEDTAATVDSDDFRMRWGLLHGNALLRNAKSQMRNVSAQNFTYSFTKRTSAGEIYGTMANNGLTTSSTFRLRIGSTFSDITIDPSDTLETIAAKINDDTATAQARNLHYDSNGQKLEDALLKATVEQDKLVISSSGNDEITISGTAAMNALKMNYTYKGVYQLGIGVNANATLGSTSTVDLTKAESGELEFNTDKFMEALEDNPDETQELMLMYANSMDNWVKSMTTASNDEYGSPTGSLSREIKNLENEISDIDEYLEKYQERLDRMEESLRTKYAAAEQRISKLSQQASAIASILQQLSNSGGNNNSSASS
ncbi:MAG: flagellar filament capping protein FliD, partial [Synergistaceae bacterium]|nr:flagellar filament capping protein FliD [Synergistaceae bacterium]